MHKVLLGCFGCAAALLAGCATVGSDETGARLPTGVTLLDSNTDRCSGTVHVDERSAASRDIVLRPGENAAFRVDDRDRDRRIEWTCIGQSSSDRDSVSCPDRTSYVRITRPSNGDQMLVECYGKRSG